MYTEMINTMEEYERLVVKRAVEVNNKLADIIGQLDDIGVIRQDYCGVALEALEADISTTISLSYTGPWSDYAEYWEIPVECLDMNDEQLYDYALEQFEEAKEEQKKNLEQTIKQAQVQYDRIS